MINDQSIIKQIILEYQIKYNLDPDPNKVTSFQLKIIEDDILRITNIAISESTLRRIFQQKTGNPQLATLNALCICLGYNNYSEYVRAKSTKNKISESDSTLSEPAPPTQTKNKIQKKRKKQSKWFFIGLSLLIGGALLFITGKVTEKLLFNSIIFEPNRTIGTQPTTFHIICDIPWLLPNHFSIEYIDADGSLIGPRKIEHRQTTIHKSFFLIGTNTIRLKYKERIIRELQFVILKNGWNIRIPGKDLSMDIRSQFIKNGTLSIPFDSTIISVIQKNNIFSHYQYYSERSLGDGNNFTIEAKVCNSERDGGIPYYDINVDVSSDNGSHAITFNSQVNSYNNLHSGEIVISGEFDDLSHIKYFPSEWQVIIIKVENQIAKYYINDELQYTLSYKRPLSELHFINIRFKGLGAIDYVRITDKHGKCTFFDDFNE
ncbi:MAG: hypothetical protein PUB21_00575 [Bacteroidales bacterium]|nr:hypothetical protein [Bacteroidales bacterium]